MESRVPHVVDGWYPLGEPRARTDDEVFEALAAAVFQARFRPAVVRTRWPAIRRAFAEFRLREVARWPDSEAERLLEAPGMIRSPKKVRACLRNSRQLARLSDLHGNLVAYLDSFAPDLEALAADIDGWASYVGAPSIRWFLTCVGLPSRWARRAAAAPEPKPTQDGATR